MRNLKGVSQKPYYCKAVLKVEVSYGIDNDLNKMTTIWVEKILWVHYSQY